MIPSSSITLGFVQPLASRPSANTASELTESKSPCARTTGSPIPSFGHSLITSSLPPLASPPSASTESDNPGPLAELERAKDAQALARCLQGLDAKQRQAIALAFYDGLSHSELASHLREPLGTVKTWVRRGLLRLKSCLELQEQA